MLSEFNTPVSHRKPILISTQPLQVKDLRAAIGKQSKFTLPGEKFQGRNPPGGGELTQMEGGERKLERTALLLCKKWIWPLETRNNSRALQTRCLLRGSVSVIMPALRFGVVSCIRHGCGFSSYLLARACSGSGPRGSLKKEACRSRSFIAHVISR